MNLKKLAEICEVSTSTVSKAFSDSSEISEKTKQHIFSVAKKYGCFYKYYSKSFEKKVVAVIISEIRSEWYTSLVQGLEKIFSAHDIILTISETNFKKTNENRLIQYYTKYAKVDGLIIIGGSSEIKQNYKIPIINMLGSCESDFADSIYVKGEDAAYEAMKYLKNMGHREIAFIGEELTLKRQEYFLLAMRRLGLKVQNEYIIVSNNRFELAGYAAMNKILSSENQPTAIVAAYSYIADGVVQCIKDNQKSVPEDFSVVAMDDIFSEYNREYNFARISMQRDDICETAAEMILKKIYDPEYKVRKSVTLFERFIPGNTVKMLKN